MAAHNVSEDPVISLVNQPATPKLRRLVLALAGFLFAGIFISAPFATLPQRRFDAFIPSIEAIIFVNDFITSVLLFTQYSIVRTRAILVLASGYLFTALIVIPHALTFPGAFAPTGLLGVGLQSTGWLYYFWHIGSASAVLVYAILKDANPPHAAKRHSVASAIAWSAAVVTALVCGLTWLAITGEWFLPALFSDSTQHIRTGLDIFIPLILLIGMSAIATLWVRRRSVLDYWLMLVVWALILEQVLIALLSDARFSLGFYTGRIFSLVTSIIVLVVLLAESSAIHARLAAAMIRQRRERESRHMTVDSVTASIAHEINQPLTAIVANGGAALRFLKITPPNLDETQAAVKTIVHDAHRAGEVLRSLREMFKKGDQEHAPLDINMLIHDVLTLVHDESRASHVFIETRLSNTLPNVNGNRFQLQQVILNLVVNAFDAMKLVTNRRRVLRLRTAIDESEGVLVTVEDTGTGIDLKDTERIFDSFFTTKSHGMGVGLFLCRSIVEAHSGRLWADSDVGHGAVFNILLPAVTAGVDK
jgi:signal transduction histidine kinase